MPILLASRAASRPRSFRTVLSHPTRTGVVAIAAAVSQAAKPAHSRARDRD
jgi:hypothetical protein